MPRRQCAAGNGVAAVASRNYGSGLRQKLPLQGGTSEVLSRPVASARRQPVVSGRRARGDSGELRVCRALDNLGEHPSHGLRCFIYG